MSGGRPKGSYAAETKYGFPSTTPEYRSLKYKAWRAKLKEEHPEEYRRLCDESNARGREWRLKKKLEDPIAWKEREQRHIAQQRGAARLRLLKKYNLTAECYAKMLIAQGGGCAVCGNTIGGNVHDNEKLHIDHSHQTGIVRGLLCSACNTGLGKFKDDASLLRRAIGYIERQEGIGSCLQK